MTWTPPPGSIGLTYAYGLTHLHAAFGQMLSGDATRYTHAFVCLGGGRVMEPWPRGARAGNLADYDDEYVAFGWPVGLSWEQREALVAVALSLDGARYGIADYAAIAAVRRGWRWGCARRRVAQARLTPARFVVEVYRRAGVPLLDGTPSHEVTLEDIGELFLSSTEWALHVPATYYA